LFHADLLAYRDVLRKWGMLPAPLTVAQNHAQSMRNPLDTGADFWLTIAPT
jgi:hypothetical protein